MEILTLLPDNMQERERWLVKLVVLPVSCPRQGKILWHDDCPIGYLDYHEKQKRLIGKCWH